MKKSWGRLGAVVGAVALLAGGLVGVAAPANAVGVTDVLEENQAYCTGDGGQPDRYTPEKSDQDLAEYCANSGLFPPFFNAKYAQSWNQATAPRTTPTRPTATPIRARITAAWASNVTPEG